MYTIRLDDGTVLEFENDRLVNGNTQSFSEYSIAKRHLKSDAWAVEMEIPANSPGYYGTLLNPGAVAPACRVTRDPAHPDASVREDWNRDLKTWEFHG